LAAAFPASLETRFSVLKSVRFSDLAGSVGDWDAVIVGAGPAGAVAARQLALMGHRVLLVEKKPFPRFKVCGGCLNARAISILAWAGLAEVPRQAGAAPLNQVEICSQGNCTRLALPASLAVSRFALDELLVHAAMAAGAEFLPQTTAHIGETDPQGRSRSVHLHNSDRATPVRAKVVIAADGLQHSSLSSLPAFASRVDNRSRLGLGATFADDTYDLPPHTVRLCVARDGYAGLARVEERMLNVAAAVSPSLLRTSGSPGQAVAKILAEARSPLPRRIEVEVWHGTPALTRTTQRLADERLFLIGDATGYVEPFTGEGMSWALESALRVAPLVDACIQAAASPAALANEWQVTQQSRMQARQAVCRWIAWTLRTPTRVGLSLRLARMFPSVVRRIVAEMNRPLDGSSLWPPASHALPCPR
jgi:flavin-dependent dehydrogenase